MITNGDHPSNQDGKQTVLAIASGKEVVTALPRIRWKDVICWATNINKLQCGKLQDSSSKESISFLHWSPPKCQALSVKHHPVLQTVPGRNSGALVYKQASQGLLTLQCAYSWIGEHLSPLNLSDVVLSSLNAIWPDGQCGREYLNMHSRIRGTFPLIHIICIYMHHMYICFQTI